MNNSFNAANYLREITFSCGESPVVAKTTAPAPPPCPAPTLAPAPVVKPVRVFTLQGDANFATNESELTPVAQRSLDEFIRSNEGFKVERLIIWGYTDSTGSLSLNQRLSEARALSVQRYLLSHGLRAEQYDVKGFGPASPTASNATASGRAQNRRVEIRTDGVEVRAVGR